MANSDSLIRALMGVPTPRPRPSALIEALTKFPGLGNPDVGYVYSPQSNPQNLLEYWSATETGSPDYPRPDALPMGKAGIEVTSPATRPIDIAGDLVSHGLVESDPHLKNYYQQFQSSLSKNQHDILQEQYQYAKSQGERRPFDSWLKASGMPAYFRGYAFQQWPKADTAEYYTPDQVNMFDEMMRYLRTPPKRREP
jgi:hypothetical protein